jgi:hypothetical protein
MKPDENGAIPMKVVAPRLPGGREVGGHTGPARRRSALVTWLTADDNPWFARHAVNSTWQELLGTPLVSTLDDPEVAARGRMGDMLDILAADFVAGGYRLKPLIRSIVLSRAYQSAPAVPREGADDAALVARRESYAAYPTRPLTVDQLYDSLIQATGARSSEEATPESPPAVESPDDEALAYADRPVESLGEHGVSLQRALVMLNGATAQEAARSAARIAVTLHGRRIGRAHVEWLFLSTLSRRPAEAELSTMIELVGSDRGVRGLEDVAWVLVNSAEFQTNH